MPALTEAELQRGVRLLARRDPDLGRIFAQYGYPPLWDHPPGFPTLVHIILEQQVSLASALAAFNRLRAACVGRVTPGRILLLTDEHMLQIGFSRQKAGYARELARAIVQRRFKPSALPALSDDAVREALIAHKGIGPWTADIYLLMVLLRPDVWPHGDLALAIAVQNAKRLSQRPSYAELSEMAQAWKPWRAVAARLFWHYYLSRKNQPELSPPTGA
ncbi:MAG: DNA-3-methyladenine glycosylase 2 family protein [Anaerolineales bacterium]